MMDRRQFLGAALALPFGACRSTYAGAGVSPVAFSLRRAEHLLRAGRQMGEIQSLAGIGRFLGLIHDRSSADVVIVGHFSKQPDASALDVLVSAIRARVIHKQWPLVSIDRDAATEKTNMQRIRWEGGVENLELGRRLLLADIVLKKAALGQAPRDPLKFASYFDLCYAQASKGSFAANGSRFWFHAEDAVLLSRENVFALQDLNLGVKAKVVEGATSPDDIAIRYAAEFARNLDAIGSQHPEIAALAPAFGAVAAARGIEMLPPATYEFWAQKYQPAKALTPSEYPLIRRQAKLRQLEKELSLELSGGVDTAVFVQRLTDGDHVAFQDAVLKTRPSADSLFWQVPVSAWLGRGEVVAGELRALKELAGTTIQRVIIGAGGAGVGMESEAGGGNRGGVYEDVPVGLADIKKK